MRARGLLLFVGFLVCVLATVPPRTGAMIGIAAASTAKPKATATAPPTPKPLPKSVESVLFNGKMTPIKGFYIFATPSPVPSPSPVPTPKPSNKPSPTPKPIKFPSVEQITQIDENCEGMDAAAFSGAVALRPVPCPGPYLRAKDFAKLIGAKITLMVTPPPMPDGELAQIYASPSPTPTGSASPLPTPYAPLAALFTGLVQMKYCGQTYSGTFFMNKLTADGGKPNVNPIQFLDAINAHINTTNLKGISNFTYSINGPSVAAAQAAGKVSGSSQPPYTLTITGPISCKAKRKKPSGDYEVQIDSTIETVAHQTGVTLNATVQADFGITKSSGNVMFMKLPHLSHPPATSIVAQGGGALTLSSYSANGKCGKNHESDITATDPVSGSGRVTLLGSAKAPTTLVFDTGLTTNNEPRVSLECEGHGADSGPAIWAAGFNAAHIDAVSVGGFFGGFADLGYAILLEPSVDGKTSTAHFSRSVTAGDSTVTETTDVTVTKLR